jgi:hypothetical protein
VAGARNRFKKETTFGFTRPKLTVTSSAWRRDVGLPAYIDGLSNGYDDIPALNVAGVATNAGGPSGFPFEF